MRSTQSGSATLAVLALGLASCGLFVSFSAYDDAKATAADGGLRYAVKGTADGLAGAKITLLLNGANPIDDVGEGHFVFATTVPDGAGYVVTVKADPPGRACTVAGGAGTIAGGDATGVAVHCVGAPTHPASFLRAPDQDPIPQSYDGIVTIGKAADESDVLSYELYWATDALAKVAKITSLPKTAGNVVSPRTGRAPATATRVLVLTANAAGEMTAGVSVAVVDNFPVYVDISAGQGPGSGTNPKAVIDAVNGKLLVATQNSQKPSLFRCNLDGTSCTHTDISAGQAAGSGGNPSIAIDAVNRKLLVVTQNAANSSKPSLFRCDLDGTNCTYADISASQGPNSGGNPTAVIDVVNSKLLVVTDNNYSVTGSDKPSLFRCDLDGTGCTHTDLSAGQAPGCGYTPTATIDAASGKLVVVTQNFSNGSRAALFRCELNGTGCIYADLSAGQGASTGYSPSVVIDAANSKLVVVTDNSASSDRPSLFRCNLDGTSCAHTDLSAGQGSGSGLKPSAVIDAVNGKLLVTTSNGANSLKSSLFRCNLDGTGCSHVDISAGQATYSGELPSAVIDGLNSRLLVVTQNASSLGNRPGLFMLGLW